MSPLTPSEPSTALNIESVALNVTQTRCIAPNMASKITHVSSFKESVTMESDASNVTKLISSPSSMHCVGSITPTVTCKQYDAPTKAPYVNDGTTCSNKCSAAYSSGPPISIMQSVLSGTFGSIDSNELVVLNLVCGRNEFTCNLQNLIDETVANLDNPWQGSLPFKVHVMLDGDDITKVMENNDPELVDICEYLGGAKYPTKRLYFSPALYPPPTDQKLSGCGDCKSWMCLKKDLMRSAYEAGHTIVANGRGDRHSLLCSHSYRDFKSKAMQLTDDNKYRNTSLIGNDKENRRIEGKSKPRRRNISNREHRCPFRFDVKWDKHGFFVKLERRSGNQCHQFHPKFDASVIPLSTRLLTEAQKEDVNHVIDIGHGSHGPGYMQLGPGIEPRTDKKITSYDTGFEPRTHVPYKKSFVAQSTKNTNVHVERVHDVHVECRQRLTKDGQTNGRRTTARPTEFLDLRKKIQDPKIAHKKDMFLTEHIQ
jgi:hypothetical protein